MCRLLCVLILTQILHFSVSVQLQEIGDGSQYKLTISSSESDSSFGAIRSARAAIEPGGKSIVTVERPVTKEQNIGTK